MRLSKSSSVILLGIVAAVGGCGGAEQIKHPSVVPAAGVVTYNGAPVEGATVAFFSETSKKEGWSLTGQTDASGKFEITSTFAPGTVAKGVPAGDFTAVVIKTAAASTGGPKGAQADPSAYADIMKKNQEAMLNRGAGAQPEAPKNVIPKKYAAEITSDLKVTVGIEGKKDIELTLAD